MAVPNLIAFGSKRSSKKKPKASVSITSRKESSNSTLRSSEITTSMPHRSISQCESTSVKCKNDSERNVKIIVGDETFHHSSYMLKYSCRYFAKRLSEVSSSKEDDDAEQLIIRFPKKDPKEWRLVVRFLEPYSVQNSQPKITDDNVDILLPWFQELELHSLLRECDMVYAETVEINKHLHATNEAPYLRRESSSSSFSTSTWTTETLSLANQKKKVNRDDIVRGIEIIRCIKILKLAEQYNLVCTHGKALICLRDFVEENPHMMGWPEFYESVSPFLHHDMIWTTCVERYLPPNVLKKFNDGQEINEHELKQNRLELLKNPLLEELIATKVIQLCCI